MKALALVTLLLNCQLCFSQVSRGSILNNAKSSIKKLNRTGKKSRSFWKISKSLNALYELYLYDKDEKLIEEFIEISDFIFSKTDKKLRRVKDGVRKKNGIAWSTKSYSSFGKHYYAFLVHSAIITYPIAKFVNIILNDPFLNEKYGIKAQSISLQLMSAVNYFNGDWRSGRYIFRDKKKRLKKGSYDYSNKPIPVNMMMAMGLTLIELAENPYLGKTRHGHVKRYKKKVKNLVKYFKKVSRSYKKGLTWNYSEYIYKKNSAGKKNERVEDASHGGISAEFITRAYYARFKTKVSKNLMKRMVNTFKQMRYKGYLSYSIDGRVKSKRASSTKSCAKWVVLGKFNKSIKRSCEKISSRYKTGLLKIRLKNI